MESFALTIGVIGHVDHGKTALVRALTGIETDRLEEEKRRGISIALGFAHLQRGAAVLDMIDMPGHERFVRTMIAGATGVRAVLLVVAANEGVRPQTVEHAEIAALLGVRQAAIAVTKCDLAETAEIERAELEASDLAERCGLVSGVPHRVSALTGQGLDALAEELVSLSLRTPPAPDRGFAFLPIDRAFSITGHGTVVTGTLRGGSVAPGDELELLPGGQRIRLRGVQVRGKPVERAAPGQRTALNLRGVAAAQVPRGTALASPGLLAPSAWLSLALRAAPSAPAPLRSGARLRLLYGTAEADATVRLLDRSELAPGESCFAQLRCVPRVVLPVGEHVVLRLGGPPRAVAGGPVLDANALRLRRDDPAALSWIARLANDPPETIARAALERAGARGATVLALARLAGLSVQRTEAALREAGAVMSRGHAVIPAALSNVQSALLHALGRSPAGLGRERLAAQLGGCGAAVLDIALTRLGQAGRIEAAGGKVRLVVAAQQIRHQQDESSLAARHAEAFRRAGLSPPTGMPADPATRRALEKLVREGVLVRTFDRVQKREVLFHREAIEKVRLQLRPLLERGVTVSEVGAALGISRKYSVPLLEFFSAIQFTRRVGDKHMLREAVTVSR